MTKKKEEAARVRKAYAPNGERGQKPFAFRLDNENVEWLNQQPNKGRYINELIAADRNRTSGNSEKKPF